MGLLLFALGAFFAVLLIKSFTSDVPASEAGGTAVLVCDPDLAQSQFVMKEMKRKGITFARILPSGSLEVVADIVSHGCGIGILPSKVAERARKKLKRLPKAPVFIDEHCLIYRVENKGVKSVQVLNAAIKSYF